MYFERRICPASAIMPLMTPGACPEEAELCACEVVPCGAAELPEESTEGVPCGAPAAISAATLSSWAIMLSHASG